MSNQREPVIISKRTFLSLSETSISSIVVEIFSAGVVAVADPKDVSILKAESSISGITLHRSCL